MPIPAFTHRTLMPAVEILKPPRTFLRSTFFPRDEVSNTDIIEFDVRVGARRLAPFVSPLHEGKVVEKLGYSPFTFKPAYIKEKVSFGPQEFFERGFGEGMSLMVGSGGQLPAARIAARIAQETQDLQDEIDRRIEWMCAQVLLTGKVQVTGDGIDVLVDFLRAAGNTITLAGADLWSATTTADPIRDLEAWSLLIARQTGLTATSAIIGSDAWAALRKIVPFMALLDNRRVELGQLKYESLPDGVFAYGSIGALNLYGYNEWYLHPTTGVETAMLPADKVIIGGNNSRAAVHFGAIEDMAAGLQAFKSFPKSWDTEDPSRRWVMLQSAPLPVPYMTNAFICADVL